MNIAQEFKPEEKETQEETKKCKKGSAVSWSLHLEEEEEKHEEKKKRKGPVGGGFVDGSKMKDDLKENLDQKEYNVFDFYYETGFWQALAKNDRFGHLTLGVISLNAVWIGVDSDHNTQPPGEVELVFVIADQFFCVFFSFEWLARFLAFEKKRNCLKDGWFKFDSALVFLMVFETWLTPLFMGSSGGGGMGDASMLRLLRLLRLTRMARLMRAVPELLVLLKGMIAAARSVSSTLALLLIFDYVFGIIFKQQTAGDEELEVIYGQIPEAMWNLLLGGTLLDNITVNLNLLRERNKPMCAVFLFWVLLSSFTILNMLIGVLCEVVSAVSEAEKEKSVVSFAKSKFLSVLQRIDDDGNGTLSEGEFENFLMDEEVQGPLEVLEVDRDNLFGLKDVIFAGKNQSHCEFLAGHKNSPESPDAKTRLSHLKTTDLPERELQFGELLEMILDLRASNPAMVSHVVDLRKHLRANQKESRTMLQEMSADITDMSEDQSNIHSKMDKIVEHQHKLETDMHKLFSHQERRIDQIIALQQQMMAHQGFPAARPAETGTALPESHLARSGRRLPRPDDLELDAILDDIEK